MQRPAGLRASIWSNPFLLMLLLFLPAVLLAWPTVRLLSPLFEQDEQVVIGEIRMIGTGIAKQTPNRLLQVIVPDGSQHSISVNDHRSVQCQVGAKVELLEADGRYRLSSNGCNINENLSL